ncbi:uncharacterized protein LOC117172958 isoform X2 [Belonocnema kinseyi]|nr:uncharacterized protein LOC117172958 isoform X2 [Belonocnema kinseyi]
MTKYDSPKEKQLALPIEENKSFLQIQIFETISSTFCNAYTTVKQSNETITNILNETEKSLGKGSEFIGSTIEKIPTINIPAEEIIENLRLNFRLTFLSTIEWCENIVSSVINTFNNLSITNEDKTDKTKGDKAKSLG